MAEHTRMAPATVQPVAGGRFAIDVNTFLAHQLIASTTVSLGGTTTVTIASGTVLVGDIVYFTTGALTNQFFTVSEVTGTTLKMAQTLPVAPTIGDALNIFRSGIVRLDSTGRISVRNTEYGTAGLPNFYWNIGSLVEIPTTVLGDPTTGIPLSIDTVSAAGVARVHGSTAHDSVDAGNPIKIGGKASTSEPAAVANGDRVDAYYDANGYAQVKVQELPAPAALSDAFVAVDVSQIGAFNMLYDTSISRWVRVPGTVANGIDVDVTRVTGTVTISGTVTASNTAGNVAHDGVDSGNPVKIGHKARTAHVTAVANNDRSDRSGDTLGFAGVTLARNGRDDTFTTTANGTTLGDGFQNWKYFGLSVRQTGVVTSWTVVLEYSLDNVVFTTFLTHTNIIGTSVPVFSIDAIPRPVYYMRARCTAIVLGAGTNVISTIIGVQ
jgi:hypothetical protein